MYSKSREAVITRTHHTVTFREGVSADTLLADLRLVPLNAVLIEVYEAVDSDEDSYLKFRREVVSA